MKDLQNKDYPLKPGTLVVLPLIRNTVYVLGEVKHPGPVVIESYEKATLNTVISKAGGLTENASEIQLIKDNKKTIFDLNESLESQTEIESGSIVYVEKLPERFVYLISPSVGGKVDFSREEKMSLRSLLSKYNLLDFESEEKLILLTGDGEKTEVKLTDLRNKDVPLSSGTVIIYPDTRVKIYILGEVRSPGVFAINPGIPTPFPLLSPWQAVFWTPVIPGIFVLPIPMENPEFITLKRYSMVQKLIHS